MQSAIYCWMGLKMILQHAWLLLLDVSCALWCESLLFDMEGKTYYKYPQIHLHVDIFDLRFDTIWFLNTTSAMKW